MPQPRRILIADDDVEVQRAVQREARRHGYEVVGTLAGAEVTRMAIETRPELIVLDVCFPDADGRDILAQLKAHPATRTIPVLVWSARDTESDRAVALTLGAEDYVEKWDVCRLLSKIKRILLRHESGQRAGNGGATSRPSSPESSSSFLP